MRHDLFIYLGIQSALLISFIANRAYISGIKSKGVTECYFSRCNSDGALNLSDAVTYKSTELYFTLLCLQKYETLLTFPPRLAVV